MRKKRSVRKKAHRLDISGLIKDAEGLRGKAAEIIQRMKALSIEIDKHPPKTPR
jgi:hypothetical protein